MRKRFLILLSFFVLSCNSSKKEKSQKEEIVYDMYEPSEMANLMNEMYDYNLKLKQNILDNQVPETFPENFLKIHTAKLSEFKYRNDVFKSFSTVFISAQKEIFNPNSDHSMEARFNTAVNVCISCHQTECTGPIPKIKKLLIK